MNVEVRLATLKDVEAVFELGHKLHVENGLFPENREKSERYIGELLSNAEEWFYLTGRREKQHGFIGLAEIDGKPCGAVCLSLQQLWYTDAWSISEIFNYVAPEYRKTDAARKLIEWAKEIANKTQLPMFIGIISEKRTEAKVRLYRRQMTPIGAFFLYDQEHAN